MKEYLFFAEDIIHFPCYYYNKLVKTLKKE